MFHVHSAILFYNIKLYFILSIVVHPYRKGSLIIDYVVQYKDNDVGVAVALVKATKKEVEFTINGEEFKAPIESGIRESEIMVLFLRMLDFSHPVLIMF